MPEFPDTLKTEHIFDMHADLEPPEAVGQAQFGARSIFIVKGGTFEGPKLRGVVRPCGGDWFLTRADGVGELDVRATLETDDGALIYMRYPGILEAKPEVLSRVFGGEGVPISEYSLRTTPKFETGSEKYAWLNNLTCVGVGYVAPNKVGYRVFAAT